MGRPARRRRPDDEREGPRKLKTYPYRPWYSVAFYRDGKVIRWNAYRLKLNYREGKLAAACTRAAVR